MFRKQKYSKEKIKLIYLDKPELQLNEEDDPSKVFEDINKEQITKINVDQIKKQIDQKIRKINKGISTSNINEKIILPFKKEENRESTVKKLFISETSLQEAKNPDEKKKLLGVKREEVDRIKEEKKKGLIEFQKTLFSLPEHLEAHPVTKNDYVENLIKLSTAGLIEVPIPLEHKLKCLEEKQNGKDSLIDNKLAEELDYLSVLQKMGPSYARGYKSDLSKKQLIELDKIFENVFTSENSRKRKLLKDKKVYENRKLEDIDE
jgi:hypothetical protein